MISATHDIDIMDAHIGVFNYRNLFRADRVLMGLALALVIVGALTLYSASRSA